MTIQEHTRHLLERLGISFADHPATMAGVSSPTMAIRAALASDSAFHKAMTCAVSNRRVRGLAYGFTGLGGRILHSRSPDYPIAHDLGKALNIALKRRGELGFGARWAGQGAPLARAVSAGRLVGPLGAELERARERLRIAAGPEMIYVGALQPPVSRPDFRSRRVRSTLDTHFEVSAPDAAVTAAPRPTQAIEVMGKVLDHAPAVVEEVLACDTRLTRRWAHGELHDNLPPLDTHVILTFYGNASRDIAWRTEGGRVASRTKSGAISLIPLGHDGRWDIDGSLEVSHVYLPDARLQAAAEQLARGQKVELLGRVAFEDPTAARLLEMLSHEAGVQGQSSRLFVEQAVDLLCTQLVRGHSTFGALTIDMPRRGLADWQVRKVTAYMREHLEEEIGLDELAALLSLSRFHFGTAFRHATGRTPHDWLVAERMDRAQALLRDPALPVTEVALSVGYQTPSSFAAAFRKAVGVTPSDFRRRL